jgi:hypothetical protein
VRSDERCTAVHEKPRRWHFKAPEELATQLRYIYNKSESKPDILVQEGVAAELIYLVEESQNIQEPDRRGPEVPTGIRARLKGSKTALDLVMAVDEFCQWAYQMGINIYYTPKAS